MRKPARRANNRKPVDHARPEPKRPRGDLTSGTLDYFVEACLLGLLVHAAIVAEPTATNLVVAGATLFTLVLTLIPRFSTSVDASVALLWFAFVFAFTLSVHDTVSVWRTEARTIVVPVPSLLIVSALLGWMFRPTHKEVSSTTVRSLHAPIIAALAIAGLALALYVPLQRVYGVDREYLFDVLYPVVAFTLLLAILAFNAAAGRRRVRVQWYASAVMLALLVKGFGG